MYCPKCGTATVEEEQRYCKACGTNLQAVNDALDRGDNKTGVLGINVGNIVKSVKENVDVEALVKNVKESVGDIKINSHPRRSGREIRKAIREKADRHGKYDNWLEYEQAKTKIAEEKARRKELQTPKPKEWLAYSWQHNLKHGLISLFSGAGLGFFLYYLGRVAIESGVIQQIEADAGRTINGLEPLFRLIWLVAIFPVLKGLGQIIYAAFFGESIATLAERFAPRADLQSTDAMSPSRNTAPQAFVSPTMEALQEGPPSVTEGTTKFFEEARVTKEQM
jgi:hypothetical protein